MNESDPRPFLIDAAQQFYQRRWMYGTAGNLSARLDDGSFWITASGRAKGNLTERDFVRLVPSENDLILAIEQPQPPPSPSAETSIHQAIYQLFPAVRACFHVHSIEANLVANQAVAGELALPPLEMLKGFGLWQEHPQVAIPVFTNHLEVPKIAQEIVDRFSTLPPSVPALLIANHGVTVWGDSLLETFQRLEIAEYIFSYMVLQKKNT